MTTPRESARILEHVQVIQDIEPFVGAHLGTLLKPVGESWQPTD